MSKSVRIFTLDVVLPSGVETHQVNKTTLVLGRSPTADIRLNDSNISREHLKFYLDGQSLKIQDLKSSNGTLINGTKIEPMTMVGLSEHDQIGFGNCEILVNVRTKTVQVSIPSMVAVPNAPAESAEPLAKAKIEPNKVEVNIVNFSDTDEEMKLDFKDVSVDLKKYKDPGEHAREIINEANFAKQNILKSAHVQKEKIVHQAKLWAKKAADKAYDDYRAKLEFLITGTKNQMYNLKLETDALLDEKKLHAMNEIDNMWKEHQTHINEEKESLLQKLKKENESELNLEQERLRNEMYIQKNKLLTEAESTILANKVAYRAQFENEKAEHVEKVNLLSKQIEELKSEFEITTGKLAELKTDFNSKQLEVDKAASNLKIENDKLEALQSKYNNLKKENSKIQENLDNYSKSRDAIIETESQAKKSVADLNLKITQLTERKEELSVLLKNLEKNYADAKIKTKADLDNEYAQLKKIEADKFEEFKVTELKELQKIRLEHTNAFKKFSVELSQEIAVKIEMQHKKSGANFNFEKNLEIINSVIQVKSAAITGDESQHQAQLDNWKQKQKTQRTSVFMSGAMAAVLVYFSGSFLYSKFSTDSLKQELTQIAEDRRQREIENTFVPAQTPELRDSYVDSTIYTENFVQVYLDDSLHDEWVKKVTMYFLQTWKIDEQKTIQVIANSRSLVQNIAENSKKLTKSRLKADLEKFKELEQENIKAQVEILGTNVKYEAYKKMEMQFFKEKLQKRSIASPPTK